MIHLFREAAALQTALDSRKLRFCFIGGIAVQHWGEPRTTRDIDISVFTGFGGEEAVVDALLGAYAGRIADARAFALVHRVLLLATSQGIEVDVALAALPFESEMIDRAALAELEPGTTLRLCSAEDLFVLKAFADRPRDRADLVGIARRRGNQLDWEAILGRLEPLAAAKDQPGILDSVRELRDAERA
ncbi:MAG: nucleotidyl transferase AbiEii/AbiGii toxin family protein [Gemmatimonadaceae bacterium]